MEPNSGSKADQPKRRACDECRGKKLACSKETDGCGRCKREGIECVYSAQKPMGRPRKRAHVEVEVEPEVKSHHDIPIPPVVLPFDSTLGMELDLSFLDMNNQDINFVDFLDPNFNYSSMPYLFPDHSQDDQPAAKKPVTHTNPDQVWLMGDYLGDIDFSAPSPAPLSPPETHNQISREDINAIMSAEIPDKLPSLSPGPSGSDRSRATPSEGNSPQPAVCACLSGLYLALDSLQHLPAEVGAAMKTARHASKAAYDAIMCDICGNPPLELNPKPPIAAFQTLMMLGALFPSLSHAYMRILEMVNDEAAKADLEHRKLEFKLEDYGGLWGPIKRSFASAAREKLTSTPMEPSLWRLVVRALLKIDVYGMHPEDHDLLPKSINIGCTMNEEHVGMKDIIAMVEERSRLRHQHLDMALAAGLIEKPDNCDYDIGGEPPCMRIIDLAKKSMRDLIIP
ncbi:hypothetical protein B0H67DRAFT_478125 [Lasiosphaeris hirsuta]|uniref:Zn(2)-C6 fungal-type domain-containing protein n=1 Tax=Lasiosphaeris hirsuta TaxID=260670 RepID=A0AA40EBZ1_9PEZI|nr:hypothetical protein B0H67DRAFT_478125 [Lasiosphaeris hirsuta]